MPIQETEIYARLDGVLRGISNKIYSKYGDVEVELIYPNKDNPHHNDARGMNISYRGRKGIISLYLNFGTYLRAKHDFQKRWSNVEWHIGNLVGSEKDQARLWNTVNRYLKEVIPMVDEIIDRDKQRSDEKNARIKALIKSGFKWSHLEENAFSVEVNYKGHKVSLFGGDVEVRIPQDKLKAVLDLIGEKA